MIASSNFLIPNATLIVEVVAFLIVLGFLGKYVLPVAEQALEARQEEIRSALEAAEAARAEAAEEQRTSRRPSTRRVARRARSSPRPTRRPNGSLPRPRSVAARSTNASWRGPKPRSTAARQRAVDEVSAQMGPRGLAVARQVIGREIDASAHRALIDEAVAALRSLERPSRQPEPRR